MPCLVGDGGGPLNRGPSNRRGAEHLDRAEDGSAGTFQIEGALRVRSAAKRAAVAVDATHAAGEFTRGQTRAAAVLVALAGEQTGLGGASSDGRALGGNIPQADRAECVGGAITSRLAELLSRIAGEAGLAIELGVALAVAGARGGQADAFGRRTGFTGAIGHGHTIPLLMG